MASKNDNTASFMMRFNQKIYKAEDGESNVQWRGKISHVQSGDQKSFSEIEEALIFIQKQLSELTKSSITEKPKAEQEGILSKSFDIWKKMAKSGPQILKEVIKDPKAQVNQIQEQISQVSDELSKNIEINAWRAASKNDFKQMMELVANMSEQMSSLTKKVDRMAKKIG